MSRKLWGVWLVVCSTALIAAGCAKHELVKKEEPIAPAVAKPAVAPKPQQSAAAVKQQQVQSSALQDNANPATEAKQLEAALQDVYFSFDSYALSSAARDTLAKDSDLLKQQTSGKIRIEGNCDERGSDGYNLALGEKRAKAAKEYLTTMGIPAERLSVISYGKEKPVDPGHDEAAWAKNRRDDFVILR